MSIIANSIKLFSTGWLLALSCLVPGAATMAQCPPSGTAWMEKITAIEWSDESVTERTSAFETLQSLHVRCKAGRDSILARILQRLGDLSRQTGDVEKGIRYTKEAIAINSSGLPGASRPFLTHSYYNMGLYYSQLYLFSESNNYFDSSIQLGTQYPQKNFIALMAFEQKAYSFFQMADYQQTIETAEHGVLLAQKLGDSLSSAYILMQKAQAQLALNRAGEAEKNIKEVIRVLSNNEHAGPEYLASSYSIYAELLTAKKDLRKAVAFHSKAYELNKKQGNYTQCARDMINLGYLYDKEMNEPHQALAAYRQGLPLAKQVNDAYLSAGLYINMGVVYWRRKQYQQALRYYQQALNILPIHFTDTSITANPTAAMLKFTGNDYFVYTLLANKGEALLDLYKKEKNKALLTTALASFRLTDKMVDQLRWKQYHEGSKLFWREQTKKIYEQSIETCFLLQSPEDAFYFFEKSRAVLLNDKLNELGARKFLASDDLAREQALRISLLSIQQRMAAAAENTTAYNDLRQQWLNARDAQEKFIRQLEKKYPSYYRYKYDTSISDMVGLRAALTQQQQTLIEYFNGDSTLYILAIKPSGIGLHQVPFRNYGGTARELLAIASDRSQLNQQYDRYRRLASGLHDSLFGKLAVTTKRVIISPDDHFIPFELLLTDSAVRNSFLVKRYAVSYTYSAAFLARGNQELTAPNHTLLGFAPVAYHPYLQQPPLAGADQSLQTIGSYFPSAKLFTKETATKKQFLHHLPKYLVLQLYTHANADSSGQEPVLYFADSTLHLSELQALGPLYTSLAVLAACNTGTGRNIRGEGVFSLARGFAEAGIPATVTNLWQIDNQATYQLTERFYKYLNSGMPGDEALQRAKLDFLESNDRDREMPYFWAASLFIGKATVIQTSSYYSGDLAWYIVSGIILLLMGWIGYRLLKHHQFY